MEGHTQSILDCVDDDGEVQLERLLQLQRSQMEEMEDLDEWMIALAEEEDAREREKQRSDARSVNTNRSKRSVKKRNTLLYHDTDGTVKPLTWDKSIWYLNYLENPRPADPKWNEKFRKRFRMAHESFIELGIIKLRQIIRPKYYIKMSFGRVVYGIGIGNPSSGLVCWTYPTSVSSTTSLRMGLGSVFKTGAVKTSLTLTLMSLSRLHAKNYLSLKRTSISKAFDLYIKKGCLACGSV